MDLTTKTQIYQELAYGCSTIAACLMITELAQIPILKAGSNHLKQKYVVRMLKEPLLAVSGVLKNGLKCWSLGLRNDGK